MFFLKKIYLESLTQFFFRLVLQLFFFKPQEKQTAAISIPSKSLNKWSKITFKKIMPILFSA